jgi:hypothetical protein
MTLEAPEAKLVVSDFADPDVTQPVTWGRAYKL